MAFQAFHLPCLHVIEPHSNIHQDYSMHIAYTHKVVNVFKVYKKSFVRLSREDNWPQYEGFTLYHDKFVRRKKKACLNNTRIIIEMESTEEKKKKMWNLSPN